MAYTTIDNPELYFNTLLYTANNTGGTSITGVGFQPDLIWFKNRTSAYGHRLCDSIRGANKLLSSNATSAEATPTDSVRSIDSDGFTLGVDNEGYGVNYPNGNNIASWNWKAGTAFTNDASATGIGDIDSSGSVNTTSGFSIITATSDSAADKNIAHGLGVVPDVILSKNLASTFNWDCYFKTLGYNASLQINQTAAPRTGAWGSATFTSTTFQTSDSFSSENGSPYIYYCFAEKQGYSKFGSYTGNGNADGTFVYTGFKPAFTIIKRTDTTNDWMVGDNKINPFNVTDNMLRANLSNAQQSGNYVDYLSNGFKPRLLGNAFNGSGGTYIYMAFAEAPFVTSTGVPATAR
jgi:hypothetical protein